MCAPLHCGPYEILHPLVSILVIAVNIYFVISYVISLGIASPAFILAVVILGIVYLTFCAYLTLDMVRIPQFCFILN